MSGSPNSNAGLWAVLVGFLLFCFGGLTMVYFNNFHAPIPATISVTQEATVETAVDPVEAEERTVTVAQVKVRTVVVVKGDTLWDIAERELGDATRWPELWSENQDQIDNPDLIFPGQVLTITTIEKSTSASPDVSADPPSVDPDQGSLDDVGSELPPGSNPLLRELRPDQLPRS
jgi:LysM repeat protein